MLDIKDMHEFFRSEYAPVLEKPEHRLLIQNFIDFYNSRHAAQHLLALDACAMSENCANVGVDDFGKCWHCGKPRK